MVVLMNLLTGMEPRNEMARDDDFYGHRSLLIQIVRWLLFYKLIVGFISQKRYIMLILRIMGIVGIKKNIKERCKNIDFEIF